MRADMRAKLLSTAEAAAKGELPQQEEPKADEPNLGDKEATGETEEEKPEGVVDPNAAVEENVDEEPFELEPKGPLPPRDLQAKLKANPELQAALDKDPDLKNSLFAASRLAQKAAQYDEIVGTPEEATAAVAASQQFADLSGRFSSIRDRDTYKHAIEGLIAATTLYDDAGQPLMRDGKPVTDGTVGRLIEQNFGAGLDYWDSVASSSNDDELQAAVEILKARAFGGAASAKEGFTEEQQRQAEELKQEREQLNTEKFAAETEKQTAFDGRVNARVESVVTKAIDSRVAMVEVDASDKADLTRRITEKLYTRISENASYQNALDPLLRRQGHGKAKEDARVKLASDWTNQILPKIVREEMLAMGEKLTLRTAGKKAAATARETASRSEPASAMTHTKPAEMSTHDLHTKLRGDFAKTHQGRTPSPQEMLGLLRTARNAS